MAGLNFQRILVGAVIVSISVGLVLIGIIVWRELRSKEIEEACLYPSVKKYSEQAVEENFPGFFRDPEEEVSKIQQYLGCCTSNTSIYIPMFMVDLNKINRTLVQLDKKKQYFEVDTCYQDSNCDDCTCILEKRYVTAVVFKLNITKPNLITDVETDAFKLAMCCKCLNTQMPTPPP